MFERIRLVIRYLRDKDVSFFKKLLIIGGVLYLLFPADIVPDFIIGLGILDDAAVLSFIWLALKSELDENGEARNLEENKKDK